MNTTAEIAVVKNGFPDEDRQTNGNLIAEKYAKWHDAMRFCAYLIDKGKVISAEFEDPDVSLIWHGCMFTIKDNIDLDTTETGVLSDLLACFDSLTIITEDDNITCSGVIHIYQENR